MDKEIENKLPSEGSAVQEESAADLDEAKAKSQELMDLISDLEVLKSYRKARHAGERKQVSKDERKKKKAKRRMAKKSRR